MLLSVENNNSICINADSSELERIRKFVLNFAEKFGFDDITSNKIALAVDEVCTNLIKHSYKYDSSREICLQISTDDNQFSILILDDGASFNPSSDISLDMRDYLANFRRGGLGLHIINLVMDKIQYIPRSEDFPKNKLILTKYLK
ncbi:MAG TPA: ATP-binding protein [Candidatus Kapabacteria bacterium]|jgi:serine/threonine-protein kinase RsbW|nr:ATP-binding protein [Candidatus Kapabacteria bacterium]HOM04574.1 ATP-binding protein [Candidatus Kapabacteria bacterium]HPP38996.1 ATP-binding protein [Candidatus Kapabacteria bacterium]HPU22778.1 ATP-binding protein [Candidatus Kapabacteria bacterium]